MKEFKTEFGEIVDLDNEETYSHLPTNITELNQRIQREIGFCYCYFNYWHKPWDDKQEARVEILIEKYTFEWRDNLDNLQWHRETLFIFLDEIENMC